MNHCVLEVEVTKAPTVRYTQDNKTPIAEMEVSFAGLRAEDKPGEIKVVGWGNLAQDLQSNIAIGQKLVIEGRLRMNTVPRQDGTKEKKAELTLSRLHFLSKSPSQNKTRSDFSSSPNSTSAPKPPQKNIPTKEVQENEDNVGWNSSPLVPDTDDIPF